MAKGGQFHWYIHKEHIVEFDAENNEFVITDSAKIVVPETLNNEPLNQRQKDLFRRGLEVQTTDGSRFRFSAVQPIGIHAEVSSQTENLDKHPHQQRSGPSR